MNVNEIRERILEMSHDESAPDTALDAKGLRWLNSAYFELMDECMPYLSSYLETSEDIELVNGVGELAQTPSRILRVVDITHSRVLQQVEKIAVVDKDPTLEQIGAPVRFWMDENMIHVHPNTQAHITVHYIPVIDALEATGTQNDILLPAIYHDALVWGGLVWASVYERGFATQSEITLFQSKWEEAKRRVKLSLAAKPSSTLRVKPYDVA